MAMASKLRWGIIGNALIGRKCMLPAIAKTPGCIIHALATSRPHEAAELVTQYGIARLYEDYRDLLVDPEVDAVYLPLPNHLHLPVTLAAVAAGKHVLCEKPLAGNASQARTMADAAAAAEVVLMEAMMYRFHPRSRRVKALVDEGAIGAAKLVRATFCFSMDEHLLDSTDNYRLIREQGGGALLDVGCYCVSVARWLLGAEPDIVQAAALYHNVGGADIHLVGNLRFGSDALASIEVSFGAGLQQSFTVVGGKGAIELPHNTFIPWEQDAYLTIRRGDQEEGERLRIPGADEYQLLVEHFRDVVCDGAINEQPVSESIANLQVLDAMDKAARTMTSVLVPRTGG
jgi:xylose dehydrogenase (NAD/NADP)